MICALCEKAGADVLVIFEGWHVRAHPECAEETLARLMDDEQKIRMYWTVPLESHEPQKFTLDDLLRLAKRENMP